MPKETVPYANPYIVEGPVTEPDRFFGRLDLFVWVRRGLEEGQRALAIEAPYRMGKTSFLNQLSHHLYPHYAVFLLDMGKVTEQRLDLALWQVAEGMVNGLSQEERDRFGGLERGDFEGNESHFVSHFLPRISSAVGERPLLLALDDLDLLGGGDDPAICASLLSHLSPHLYLFSTWEEAPEGLEEVPVWRLGPLSREEAERLITEPSAETLIYEYDSLERIWWLTSGHPYFLQLLCHALFERCAPRGRVTLLDVQEIAEGEVLDRGYLAHLIARSSPQERTLLTALGVLRGTRGLVLEEEVRYLLEKRGLSLSSLQVSQGLERLAAKGLLEALGPATYRFQVELLHIWLVKEAKPEEGERLTGVAKGGLQKFLWPLAALSLVIILFLLSTRSRSPSLLLGRGTPYGATGRASSSSTPSVESSAGALSLPLRPTIAYMVWEEGSGTWEIYTMASDGSNRTRLTQNEVDDTWPSWSPDGRKIVFVSERDGNQEIYLMDAQGSRPVNLSRNQAPDAGPSLSPDGSRIVFTSRRDGNWEIYMMDADGSDQAGMTFNQEPDYAPAWSPDGTKIAFASERDGNLEIYVMNAGGSGEVRVTYDEATDTSPAWSPDGTKIAFESYRDGDMEIYIMNADGSDQRNLTRDHTADDHGPSWSPDGAKILYYSNREGNWDLYTIEVDGTDRVNLTQSPADEQAPTWAPWVW